MKRLDERLAHQALDFGPLFGGKDTIEEPARPRAVDPDERLAWARDAILASNLETFTAEDVRRFVEEMRPELLGSGFWIASVFRCDWFRMLRIEQAEREVARRRWLWRYELTPAGQEARRGRWNR